jgi:Raf kinase inhibitor-like YbhB/YbcL family protein
MRSGWARRSIAASVALAGLPAALNVVASEEVSMAFTLTSAVFTEGSAIPSQYTCDGQDASPPLAWTDPPAGTKAFALISDDPDAPMGTWVHWVAYNLPSSLRQLKEGLSTEEQLSDGTRQGTTDFGRTGYGGPCPPSGTHRYFFKLYALDTTLSLAPGATKKQLEAAMQGHVLAQAQLMGTYRRKGR